MFPIRIPIYNVGVGFAQNCSVVWDRKSINDACNNIINLLSNCYAIHEFDISDISDESGKYWATQDFIFIKKNNDYDTVSYYRHYSSENNLPDINKIDTKDNLICDNLQIQYMLPVLQQTLPSYITLSDGLSMLLLEIANQKIYSPITFFFDIKYQDLTGLDYMHTIQATFQLGKHELYDPKLFFDVSFEILNEDQ